MNLISLNVRCIDLTFYSLYFHNNLLYELTRIEINDIHEFIKYIFIKIQI